MVNRVGGAYEGTVVGVEAVDPDRVSAQVTCQHVVPSRSEFDLVRVGALLTVDRILIRRLTTG